MYERANHEITKGLSLGARILLGVFSGLFGIIMILCASPGDKAIYSHLCGGFFLLIAIGCVTKGRVRQFIGSAIGCSLLVISIWYVAMELREGDFWSRSPGQPSIFKSILFLFFIGIPGGSYSYKTLFGFRKNQKYGVAINLNLPTIVTSIQRFMNE